MLRVMFYLSLLISSSWLFLGCSSSEKKSDTPEGAYSIAQDYEKDERYEEAIRHYQDIRNKFPYSRFAIMSEMAMADVYYKQESFIESQVAYQNFKDFHPKHPQIDYVTFKLAMSFFNQLPSSVDRDLSLAASSMIYFDEVIKNYPSSIHFKDAKDKREAAYKMLAGKEEYIADFYFKKKFFDSALPRYEAILKKYSNSGLEAKTLARASICSAKIGDMDKAKKYLKDLKDKYPDFSDISAAEKEVK